VPYAEKVRKGPWAARERDPRKKTSNHIGGAAGPRWEGEKTGLPKRPLENSEQRDVSKKKSFNLFCFLERGIGGENLTLGKRSKKKKKVIFTKRGRKRHAK